MPKWPIKAHASLTDGVVCDGEKAASAVESSLDTAPELSLGIWTDGKKHACFDHEDDIPLTLKEELGKSEGAMVRKAECGGLAVAYKTKRFRKMPKIEAWKEPKILERLDDRHVIRILCTFQARYPYHVLGSLTWPVGVCNLDDFLDDVELLQRFSKERLDYNIPDRITMLIRDVTFKSEALPRTCLFLTQTFGCLSLALSYIHSHGVKHKDIKPSNIILSRDGCPRLIDFDIASDFSRRTSGSVSSSGGGTARYIAPEAAAYNKSGRPADIFSLACTFLEIISVCITMSRNAVRVLCIKGHGWYHENLDFKDTWLSELADSVQISDFCEWDSLLGLLPSSEPGSRIAVDHLHVVYLDLIRAINPMLSADPMERPNALELVQSLEKMSLGVPVSLFHGTVCQLNAQRNIYTYGSDENLEYNTFETLLQDRSVVNVANNPRSSKAYIDDWLLESLKLSLFQRILYPGLSYAVGH